MIRSIATSLLLGLVCIAGADVFRPAYLELRESGEGRYDVLWRVPAQGERMRLALTVRFPPDTEEIAAARGFVVDGTYAQRWRVRRPGGLVGETVHIDGLAAGVTDVIVRVERLDGTTQVERLLPERPAFTVTASAGVGAVAWSYLVLGFTHILAGADHLLFVLSLVLIVRGVRALVWTITAFTVAHSITLVAATLGWLRVPSPPVDAVVALSIAFVAGEIVSGLRGTPGVTARAPWIVSFSFGLLHGLGFAGALTQIGLPERAIPLALLAFNVGVEIGQLAFLAVALAAVALLARLLPRLPPWAPYVPPYAIGTVAMFWAIERVESFFG